MNNMNNMTTNTTHLRARPTHNMDNHLNIINSQNNSLKLRLGSLNCNRLSKKSRLHIQRDMIRHFREEHLDILCIQESGTIDDQIINMLNIQFTTKSALWSSKCGIVSINKDIMLQRQELPDDINGRLILAKVTHSMDYFTPFYILNIYGPATNTHAAKHPFYNQLSQIPILSQPDIRENMFIMGDLNYAYTKPYQMAMVADSWLEHIHSHFTDCITDPFQQPVPTCFSASGPPSTIDYIYVSSNMARQTSRCLVKHVSRTWTDHELLSVDFQIGITPTGKGVWRFNPILLNNPDFCSTLKDALLTLHTSLDTYGDVQQQWDIVKEKIRTVAKRFATKHISWRTKRLSKLQKLRNNISRDPETPPDLRKLLLQPINQEIVFLQQERVDIASLRAGQRWREKGESSAGYLKKTIAIRQKAKQIDQLVHPHSNALCTTTESKLAATQTFFQELFTSERVDRWKIRHVSSFIKPEQKLRNDQQSKLTEPISFPMLLEQASRAPNPSSPGPDGLTYGLLHLVFQIPEYQQLITKVYNEALDYGTFPPTWHDAIVCLLPKKGDLTLLQNHRPISLTNCDAKIFTRIINSRMTEAANHMINPFQTGFMRNRFIGDNGILLKCASDIARNDPQHAQTMALLLDFMKAYDRVNSKYLKAVLTAFAVPPTLVNTIINFFFQTKLKINVNGYLTDTVSQTCGIRQGDPLSPIIFNLALEPLLQMIIQDQNITGITPPRPFVQTQPVPSDHAIFKISTYADDLLVIVQTPREYRRLISHIDT
jgi:exonuclease III